EPVDVRESIANAVEEIRPYLDERRHTLELDLPPAPTIAEGDAVRLEQVFANLLHNAAKYTDPGGKITIGVRMNESDDAENAGRRGDSSSSISRPSSFLEVRVRDTGIGIRPEQIGRIFDMFTQGNRPSGRLKEGLGLGLTLVKTLVEMHGGTV